MSFTREQWSIAFLNAIGNKNPTQQIIDFVDNWTTQEGSAVGGQGTYNLLNTTQTMPGSYGGGSQGNIQYFNSFASGVTANAIVLKNGLYPSILTALQNNDINALGNPSYSVNGGKSTIASEFQTWGTGWKSWYTTTVPGNLNQLFPGTATGGITIPPVTGGVTGSNPLSSPGSGGNALGLLDLSGIQDAITNLPNTVLSDIFNSDLVQRWTVLFIALTVILIGTVILFFSSDSGKQTVEEIKGGIKTGTEAAVVAA